MVEQGNREKHTQRSPRDRLAKVRPSVIAGMGSWVNGHRPAVLSGVFKVRYLQMVTPIGIDPD